MSISDSDDDVERRKYIYFSQKQLPENITRALCDN